VVLSTYYTVGAVDFVFDKPYYPFLDGENIQQTAYLMRDLLAVDLLGLAEGVYFDPSNGTSFNPA
jgi:hypothetical protein